MLCKDNFKKDMKTASWIIAPAEAAFVATALPLFGMTLFCGAKLAALKAGECVLIGGEAGLLTESVRSRTWSRLRRPTVACEA